MKTSLGMLIILLLLASCTPAPIVQTVEITKLIRETVIVTQLVEVVITATPLPPTLTPTITSTPEFTPTPAFITWNTQQVVDAFKAAGLEAENAYPMNKDDYGMAPMVAIEGTRFLIPSLCADCGGRIMSFSSEVDRDLMRKYYDDLSKASALFFSWVFVKDNILVQINGDLPESTARQYEVTLNNLK